MPKYLMLINESEADFDASDEVAVRDVLAEHGAFAEEITAAGATIVGGEALQPIATATYLRHTRTEDVVAVDNPAPDLKETLGGYYLIEAADDATARRLAERCPAPAGYIQLRPIWDLPG